MRKTDAITTAITPDRDFSYFLQPSHAKFWTPSIALLHMGWGPLPSANFGFLEEHDPRLASLGDLAERYFRDDPSTAIVKLRQFAELTAKIIAARNAAYRDEHETFEETLRRLSYDRIIPKEVADVFHSLRKAGNAAVHEARGEHTDALTALKFARSLGIWFHRTYGRTPDFHPGAFVPPREPIDATAALREEISVLRQRVAESEDAVTAAKRQAQEEARARETAEERARREAEERSIWEQLAQEVEAEKASIAAKLASLQAEAETAPPAAFVKFVALGEEAATKIDLDEAETRTLIDQQLRDRGWEADTRRLRYSAGVKPAKGRSMAIAEWPTEDGIADYALFVGTTLIGVVEAKRRRKNVSAAIDQAERYSMGFASDSSFMFAGGHGRGTVCPLSLRPTGDPISSRSRRRAAYGFGIPAAAAIIAEPSLIGQRLTGSRGCSKLIRMQPRPL